MADNLLVRIPLFPLKTVLFPGARLPLRIFEPRYLSMISDCFKQDREFGVVLIRQGNEAGQPAEFHHTGSSAGIVDFDQLDDGALGVTCVGRSRFQVIEHYVERDNLVVGKVKTIDDPVSPGYGEDFERVCGFLRETLNHENFKWYCDSIDLDWSDSSLVSYKLAELLPFDIHSRQLLLEMSADQRLSQLARVLQDSRLVEALGGN